MRIVAPLNEGWPCEHPFVEEVLAKRLTQRGHEMVFVMPCRSRQNAGLHRWHGAQVWAVPGATRISRSLGIAHKALRLAGELRPDLAYVRNDAIVARSVLAFSHLPLVFQLSHQLEESVIEGLRVRISGSGLVEAGLALASRQLRRQVMRRAALVLPISDALAAMLRESGERANGMVPMPVGAGTPETVSEADKRLVRRKLNVAQQEPLFLYLGTLNRLRRLDKLIEAFAQFRSREGQGVLAFVGQGPSPADREFLERRARECCVLDFVCFVGRVPRSETHRYVAAADIGFSYFPPIALFRQNSPIKVMEFLASGLPVVCSDQPDQTKIVHECEGGIVVSSDKAEDFARAMREALMRRWDHNTIRRRLLSRYSYDVLARCLEEALFAIQDDGHKSATDGPGAQR